MAGKTASGHSDDDQYQDSFLRPTFRKLKGYAFDPSFASTVDKRQSNEVVYKIPWEDTEPGPVGEYLEVVDYDPTKRCFYEPLDLDNKYIIAEEGIRMSQ